MTRISEMICRSAIERGKAIALARRISSVLSKAGFPKGGLIRGVVANEGFKVATMGATVHLRWISRISVGLFRDRNAEAKSKLAEMREVLSKAGIELDESGYHCHLDPENGQ